MSTAKTQEMDPTTRVQILDESVCISQNVNTFGEGINSAILPLDLGKY